MKTLPLRPLRLCVKKMRSASFLALEKSKRNTILYKDYATAELREGWQKICSGAGDICASALNTHTTIPKKNSHLQFQTKSLPLKHIQTLNTKVF